jgi:ribonuclease HI
MEAKQVRTIYIDGSCLDNGGKEPKGGAAFVVYGGQEETYCRMFKPQDENPTNNRCEMHALIAALGYIDLEENKTFEIKSDSQMLIDGLKGKASRRANRDLWTKIEYLCAKVRDRITDISYVQSKDNPADKYAKQSAKAILL